LQLAVVGGGAGGVELAFCLPQHVREVCPGREFETTLIDSGARILAGMPRSTATAAQQELVRRKVLLVLGQGVQEVVDGQLVFDDGSRRAVDLVLWAAGAEAPPLLAQCNLPVDERGFLLTRATLQTTAGLPIFAVGDSGTPRGAVFPKAGVHAVRQGPVLWGNLHRLLSGQPLLEYKPQKSFLSILATGDRSAILSYWGLTFQGRWCWRLKDAIDRKYVEAYQDYSAPPPAWPALDEAGKVCDDSDSWPRDR
jgi:selenide,water dikinase